MFRYAQRICVFTLGRRPNRATECSESGHSGPGGGNDLYCEFGVYGWDG